MNKGEFRTFFTGWLNRSDLTASLADTIVARAQARIQREVRVPAMEKSVAALSAADGTYQAILLPPDFIAAQAVVADGQALKPIPLDRLLRMSPTPGCPQFYARVQGNLFLRPFGVKFASLYYWGEFDPLVNDTDTNALTDTAPEILLWASLSYAADYFQMDQLQTWEQRYQAERDTWVAQGQDADVSGTPSAISPIGGECYL